MTPGWKLSRDLGARVDNAPFARGGEVANVLMVLPERTYPNDCSVVEIPKAKQMEIVGI